MSYRALKGVDFFPQTIKGIFCPLCYCGLSTVIRHTHLNSCNNSKQKRWGKSGRKNGTEARLLLCVIFFSFFFLLPGFRSLIYHMIFCGSRSLPVLLKNNSLLNGDVAEDKLRVAKCLAITEGVVLHTEKGCTQILTSQNRKREITWLAITKSTGEVWGRAGDWIQFFCQRPHVVHFSLENLFHRVLQMPPRWEREAWRTSLGPPRCSSSGHWGRPWRPQNLEWSASWKPVFTVVCFAGEGRWRQFFSLPT